MAEESIPKWEGKAIVDLSSTSAEQAWPLLEDFFNLHKLMPLDTCHKVDEVQGKPGLTRYCASSSSTTKGSSLLWVKERLLTIDSVQRCLSYDVVDGNMGFKSYVATIKVMPSEGDDGNVIGCKIEWVFVCDPVQVLRFEDLNSNIQSSLKFMAKKIESACSVPANQ